MPFSQPPPGPARPMVGEKAVDAARVRECAKAFIEVLTDLGLSRHIDAAIMHIEDAEFRALRHIADKRTAPPGDPI